MHHRLSVNGQDAATTPFAVLAACCPATARHAGLTALARELADAMEPALDPWAMWLPAGVARR